MAITVKDVAKHAGVSPSTVSRVCNNNPSISKETRDRVQKAIAELGYELPVLQETPVPITIRHICVILPLPGRKLTKMPFISRPSGESARYATSGKYPSV